MAVLSVDLATRSWSDLGVVVLEQRGSSIHCEVLGWQDSAPPPVVELALRLDQTAGQHGAQVLMLDGPQAWKSDDNGFAHSRVSERALNTAAKMGLPGTVLPGTYERFVGYCLALYDALARLGWERLATSEYPGHAPKKILVESYPHAAWKSLGIKPLPAKRKCRVSHLAEAWAALGEMLPITASQPPNHDQLQAIVGGLPGLAITARAPSQQAAQQAAQQAGSTTETTTPPAPTGSRIVGEPPRQEGGHWREGFIVLPVPPAVSSIHWLNSNDRPRNNN